MRRQLETSYEVMTETGPRPAERHLDVYLSARAAIRKRLVGAGLMMLLSGFCWHGQTKLISIDALFLAGLAILDAVAILLRERGGEYGKKAMELAEIVDLAAERARRKRK